jgi:hypothetical protein
MAQTVHWPRHHAVEASAFATFLQHLHEDFGRRLGAADALRQQHPIKPVLDQRGHDRLRETPRPLDLIGLPRDQRRQRARALDQSETGRLVHCVSSPFWVLWLAKRNGGLFAAADQDGEGHGRGVGAGRSFVTAPVTSSRSNHTPPQSHSSTAAFSGCCERIALSRRISARMGESWRSRSGRGDPDWLLRRTDARGAWRVRFFPVPRRQDLACGQDFNADDVALGVDIVLPSGLPCHAQR